MRILKAMASSQTCSLIDFILTVTLSSLCGVYYVVATAIGSLCGGALNCIFNYKWVFPGSHGRKQTIAIKYALVWIMSILLNTCGTYLLTESLIRSSFVQTMLGQHSDQIYVLSKVIVAILIAFAWNYPLQRHFVYK